MVLLYGVVVGAVVGVGDGVWLMVPP